MKLSKKITLLGTSLCLVACGGTDSSVSSSKRFFNDTNWDDEVAKMMWDVTGEIAPYIALSEGFEYKTVDMEGDPTFYILSKNDGDLTTQYQKIVEFEGYEMYGIDSSAGYERYVYSKVNGEEEVFLQFDFYPGGYSTKGFEIFMWSDIYVPSEINYDLIDDWSKEVKDGFMDKFGEIIPLAPLSEDYEYVWVEEDKNFIFTDAKGRSDALNRYYELVSSTKEWKFSYDFWSQGYIVFEKKADNVENGVLHLNMRHNNKTGFIVDVWMTIELPPVLITEWTKEAKDAFKQLFDDENAIPLAPISDEFEMNVANQDEYTLIDILDPHPIEDFSSEYSKILIDDGFVENDYYYPRYGYHVFEKVSPQFPDYNICVNFMVVDAGVSIQLYLEEVLGGSHFTDYFPVDQMKNWMSKYNIEYKEFPTFPSVVDGMYLSESLGPDFTVQIFQNEDNANLDLDYCQMLEEDGWEIDDTLYKKGNNYWGYFATKEGCDFYMRFVSLDQEAFILHIYPNSYDCTAGYVFGK